MSYTDNELDVRNRKDLLNSFELVSEMVKKDYLIDLDKRKVVEPAEEIKNFNIAKSLRLFKIEKIVYEDRDNSLNKLINIYSTLTNTDSSLVLIIDSDGYNINFYIGTKNDSNKFSISQSAESLSSSFIGNLKGSKIKSLNNEEIKNIISDIFKSDYKENKKVVSALSNIPSFKDDNEERFVQGMENLIESMEGMEFSAVFIADSISDKKINEIKEGYENIYSQLKPFSKTELSFGENESETVTENFSKSFTTTATNNLTKTHGYTEGQTSTLNKSDSESKTQNLGAAVGGVGAGVGAFLGAPAGPAGVLIGMGLGGAIGGTAGGLIGSKTKNKSTSYSESNNQSMTKTLSEQEGQSKGETKQKGSSEAGTKGNNRTLQLTVENKRVLNILEEIDIQLDRLKEGKNYGMWDSAFYFLADDRKVAEIAANNFKSIVRGNESSVENSQINIWDNKQQKKLMQIQKYLKSFSHPLLEIAADYETPKVTPGSVMSSKELTIGFGLPKKSIKGLPVLEMAEFNRNIVSKNHSNNAKNPKINIGNIYHMGQQESEKLGLDLNSLTMHTFITGSTGAGKSNTIYNMLDELNNKDINFLVVEPTKGEYKEIFGGRDDVNVYGTNPKHTQLLKLNPFSFNDDIHVLEHIERLIEIFNACWPMYAAMPAVLKETLERAYEIKGWDLERSISIYDEARYPNFSDLTKLLPIIIDQSAYSQEIKSNYIGALVTRLKSLSNGLAGQIFSDKGLADSTLFENNSIIDLSRIGSSETKSLIMGLTFMKLQEFRFSHNKIDINGLQHITVLEEAHHLLRKTSIEQHQEGTNLQGKAVEMIANAISEMRSYGEGFIIADQSPNLLDESAIKNTNTKIILRLPETEDRKLVGSAANLNEKQIKELARLETGVAAIYQNDWQGPVLSKINYYDINKSPKYKYDISEYKKNYELERKYKTQIIELILKGQLNEPIDLLENEIDNLKNWLNGKIVLPKKRKQINDLIDQISSDKKLNIISEEDFNELSHIIYSLIDFKRLLRYSHEEENLEDWTKKVQKALAFYLDLESDKLEKLLIKHLLNHEALADESFENFYFSWVEEIEKRGESIW